MTVSVVPPAPQRRVAPLSPGRYELRLTISQEMYDKLRRAQELLAHSLPSGDIPQLLERALDELIAKQERLKFAATDKPRPARGSSNPRHIHRDHPVPALHVGWNAGARRRPGQSASSDGGRLLVSIAGAASPAAVSTQPATGTTRKMNAPLALKGCTVLMP